MKWIKKWKVPNSKNTGHYTVSIAEDGTWGCSCPAWKFRRQTCRHIREVQADPDGYSLECPDLPPFVPANVKQVTLQKDKCLFPLIPFGKKGINLLATIIYDLLELGYTYKKIKEYFNMIPKEWTVRDIKRHVELQGRCLSPTNKKEDYIMIPVEIGDKK